MLHDDAGQAGTRAAQPLVLPPPSPCLHLPNRRRLAGSRWFDMHCALPSVRCQAAGSATRNCYAPQPLTQPCCAAARPHCTPTRRRTGAARRRGRLSARRGTPDAEETGPLLKALWYASELFGDAVGALKRAQQQADSDAEPQRPDEANAALPAALSPSARLAALRSDYDVNYFISGEGAMLAYEPDCLFADAFASFRGTARFKKNVSNLGGLLSDIRLEITEWDESDPQQLVTGWRFAGTVALPWRPRLAASGGTTHVFDAQTGRVKEHLERWDIDPLVVVRQLFTPTKRRD